MLKLPTSILTGNVFNDRLPVLVQFHDSTYFIGFLRQTLISNTWL